MLNKKLLAAAVAASFTMTANAAVNLNTGAGSVTVATDSVAYKTAAALGDVALSNGAAPDVDVLAGFSVATGISRFVRIDLTNATFAAAVPAGALTLQTDADAGVTAPGVTSTVAKDGQIGDSSVVLEITVADEDLAQDDTVRFTMPNITSTGGDISVQYRLYETGVSAVNGDNLTLVSTTNTAVAFDTVTVSEFATATNATATAESSFTKYDTTPANVISDTLASLATIDFSTVLDVNTALAPNGDVVDTLAEVLDADQTLTITGEFGFGDFFISSAANCGTPILAEVAGGGAAAFTTYTATTITVDNFDGVTNDSWYFCNQVDGTETILDQATNVSFNLADDNLTDEGGQTNYNTATVQVPLLTTFDGYNQRFFLTNNGGSDAPYEFTFTTESGVTVNALAGATGTIPAGEMIVIKSRDIVELTGSTRVNATIQIQAPAAQIEALTQTVTLGDGNGQTDTVVLTAVDPS